MSQVGYITLTGYVTAEPKMWRTERTQTLTASVRVGSTPRRVDRATGEWQDGETSYYTVRCWRRLAENVHGCLRKGDMIIVRGKISTRTWVDDQQRTRTEMQVEADSVGHDLSFGWSHFNRGAHTPPWKRQGIDEGEAARHDMAPDDGPGAEPGAGSGIAPVDGARPVNEADEEMVADPHHDDASEDPEPSLVRDDFDGTPAGVGQLAEAGTPF